LDPVRANTNSDERGALRSQCAADAERVGAATEQGEGAGTSAAELLQLSSGAAEDLGAYAGADILSGASPRRVLQRVVQGDPLGLDERCLERLRHHATLLSCDRLYERAAAWVAHQSRAYRGQPELGVWLDRCIDRSIRSLLEEDLEAERVGLPFRTDEDSAYEFLSDALGIEPPVARRCALVFNHLPVPVRRTFWSMVLQRKSLHRAVAEVHGPPERARARVRYALGMMSTLGKWAGPNPDPGAPSWIPQGHDAKEGLL
jgi:hypothetical protein